MIISLNNTGEPLYLVNRSGNRPSHEGATPRFNIAIHLCLSAGFKRVLLRGDTDFTQSKALDDWHGRGVQFIFGIDAMPNLVQMAESLENKAFKPLTRKPKYTVTTQPREGPGNIKEAIVKERKFVNIRLQPEDVVEFDYGPGHCRRSYRIVVVRKNLTVQRGELALFDDVRYLFYITNNRTMTAASIVQWANGRCNQEKLIGQLKGGVRALDMPVDNLVSNWAYMVMASLAWTLKSWLALSLAECVMVMEEVQVGEGKGAGYGIPDVSQRVYEHPHPSDWDGAGAGVSCAGWESMVGGVLTRRPRHNPASALAAAVLTLDLDGGVWQSRFA